MFASYKDLCHRILQLLALHPEGLFGSELVKIDKESEKPILSMGNVYSALVNMEDEELVRCVKVPVKIEGYEDIKRSKYFITENGSKRRVENAKKEPAKRRSWWHGVIAPTT